MDVYHAWFMFGYLKSLRAIWLQRNVTAKLLGLGRRLRWFAGFAIRTVPASGAATGAALEVIGRGEDQVLAFEVVVVGVERWWFRVHALIVS
jgi:hypothetical protein